MGFFSKFPYSNGYQLNLDWIIEKIKKFENDYNMLDPDSFLRKSGGDLTGTLHVGEGGSIDMKGHELTGLKNAVNGGDAVPLRQAQDTFVKKAGDTMTGPLNMDGHTLAGLPSPVAASEAANKDYVDRKIGTPAAPGAYLPLAGGVMSGDIDMDGHELTGIQNPIGGLDAVNKAFVDGVNDAIRQWALQQFAPSGYGLGMSKPVAVSGNLDNYTESGWFSISEQITNSPVAHGSLLVGGRNNNAWQLIVSADTYYESILFRKQTNGVWGEWAWVNPPMALGVEYRTIERYNGKAVYCKLYNTGAVPSNTQKVLEIRDIVEYVRINTIVVNASGAYTTLPIVENGKSLCSYANGRFGIYLNAVGDYSAFTDSYTTVYYTKN